MMSVSVSSSRSLVGSSASSSGGELMSARAMATRRCSPPDMLPGYASARSRKPDTREQIVGARIGLPGIHGAAEQRRNGDIVHRRQVRQQARELEDEADAARAEGRQLRFRKRPDIGAVEQERAFGRPGQGAEHGHQGRFARTRPADDRDELADLELEAGVAHGLVTCSGTVAFGQCLRRQRHVTGLLPESARRAPSGAPAMPAEKRRRGRGSPKTRSRSMALICRTASGGQANGTPSRPK